MLKQGAEVLYVEAALKDLLRLFPEDERLQELSLGDTWHPASGYVDERIFTANPPIKELLADPHDWRGLIVFSCRVGELRIEKVSDTKNRCVYEFRIEGPFKTLLKFYHLLIEKDTYDPGIYSFS